MFHARFAFFLFLLIPCALTPVVGQEESPRAGASPSSVDQSLPGVKDWTAYRGGLGADGFSHSRRPEYGSMKLKWKYWTGANQSGTPAVGDGILVIGTEDGDLHGVHIHDGTKAWSTLVGPRVVGKGIVVSSPLILDGMTYVGNKAGILSAVHLKTGEIAWQYQVPGTKPEIYSSPRGDARGIVFGVVDGSTGKVICLHPKTGEVIWTAHPRREVGASAAIFGDGVYIPAKDRILYELDYKTGKVRRELALPGTTHGTPALGLGMAYVMVGSGELAGIDLVTGETAFTVTPAGDDKSTLATSGKRLFVPTGRDLIARDPLTGAVQWKFTTSHKVGPPCAVGEDVIFATNAGFVFAVDKDGRELFKIDLGEPFHSGPIVVDGVIYVAAAGMRSGFHVYALQ
ncbi:MAG TPA: PQQ-binding-like beta-propeller repeat protein [Planctomycetota bacterium]|jgi:outer membrane protein assembly factor BamB|nr:PQQ-binding-like beta-propeller repeat protein [Planctomycetota bacterium]